MVRYLWLRKRPEKIINRSTWNDNTRLGNIKNKTILTSSKLFQKLIIENLGSSDYLFLRQEYDAFFLNPLVMLLTMMKYVFDSIDDDKFLDLPSSKKKYSSKKPSVILWYT